MVMLYLLRHVALHIFYTVLYLQRHCAEIYNLRRFVVCCHGCGQFASRAQVHRWIRLALLSKTLMSVHLAATGEQGRQE